jgi:hypothetical protein
MVNTEREQALRVHEDLAFVGLRAQATLVGLVQLCTELLHAGVIDDDAVGRIKKAIRGDISVSRTRVRSRDAFERQLMERLDSIFPAPGQCRAAQPVGTEIALEHALDASAAEMRPTD